MMAETQDDPVPRSVDLASEKAHREDVHHHRLMRLDARIRNQFDLITSRTGWLLTSHSFLLGALVVLAFSNIDDGGSHLVAIVRAVLLVTIPVFGITTSGVIRKAIAAAYAIVDACKPQRERLLAVMNDLYGYEVQSGIADHVRAGDRAAKVLPAMLLGAWVFLLAVALLLAAMSLTRAFG